ncbi:hypothetical protein N7465_004959 [Penicillium sp. CMV-2018d]|nr:hypothetical protein N7465_004959 [Penicillium sp. CMV-2018d]
MTSNHEILGSTPSSLDKVFAPLGPAHMGTQENSHGLVVKRMTSNHEILGSTPSVSIFVFFILLLVLEVDLKYSAKEQQANIPLAWLSGKAHDLYIPIGK